MTALSRFLEYATAFELTYDDDDWTRLAPFLTDDAVYLVTGLGRPAEVHGRDAIFRGMQKSLNGFDRKLPKRRIEPTVPAIQEPNRVVLRGMVHYDRPGAPTLILHVSITARFDGDRICEMHDHFALDPVAGAWLAQYGADLDGTYI